MSFPEEDLPQFPAHLAESLADQLVDLASKLEHAVEARARAGSDLPEFQGRVADQFREDLDRHVGAAADLVERFRLTAGRLRDAVGEHWEARRRMIALGTGNVA